MLLARTFVTRITVPKSTEAVIVKFPSIFDGALLALGMGASSTCKTRQVP